MNSKLTKKSVYINIAKMLVLISALYIASYAWFNYETDLDLNPLSIKTEAMGLIEISLDNGQTWNDVASFDIDPDFIFNDEITGDGVGFNKPDAKDIDGSPSSFTSAVANTDYLTFEALFRSNIEAGVFLSNQSVVQPLAGTTSLELLGNTVDRKSVFGDYSRDLIAGTVRVGFVEGTYSGTCSYGTIPSLVWAPNKGYEVIYSSGVYTGLITSTNSQSYDYIEVTSPTVFAEEMVINLKDNINADKITKFASGDPILTILPGDNGIGCVKINVWVEGNDRDADYSLKGGLFEIGLNFLGLSKTVDSVAPSVTANTTTNTINNFDNTMEFSSDYGNNWTDYGTTSNPVFSTGDIVYVRKFELAEVFASAYTELNF